MIVRDWQRRQSSVGVGLIDNTGVNRQRLDFFVAGRLILVLQQARD
jgi:hypothetical protein